MLCALLDTLGSLAILFSLAAQRDAFRRRSKGAGSCLRKLD
ncbi:hypothetical protein PSP6_280012 [Paraburkholderia tropica]|nr:hypothetical protein PSP6_280012 [Paraburkholderia tropica]